MKGPLSALVVLALGLTAVAQSPANLTSSAPASASPAAASGSSTPASASSAAPSASSPAASSTTPAAPAKPADLAATLTDAETTLAALNTDLAALNTEKPASGWKGGWLKKSSHKQPSAQATQAAEAVKTHAGALPEMIAEVRTAHGSVGSAFKLFNHLTTMCEEMSALAEVVQNSGRKEDAAHLATDYSSLLRVRSNISAYVEQRAAIVDPKGNVPPPAPAVAKKDESASAKKTVAKHAAKKKPVHKTAVAAAAN
jgi:hypothetical protein